MRIFVNTFGKLTALAGFSFIVAPALLAENDLLDNTTFTLLFILGFLLVLASLSTRNRSPNTLEQTG